MPGSNLLQGCMSYIKYCNTISYALHDNEFPNNLLSLQFFGHNVQNIELKIGGQARSCIRKNWRERNGPIHQRNSSVDVEIETEAQRAGVLS